MHMMSANGQSDIRPDQLLLLPNQINSGDQKEIYASYFDSTAFNYNFLIVDLILIRFIALRLTQME
jgi:hypothetical protein